MKKLLTLLLASILMLGLTACDDTNNSNANENTGQANTSENNNNNDTNNNENTGGNDSFGIGDTVEVDGAKFTLKSVTTTDERNEFADKDPENVIAIEYELENIGDDDIPYGAELTVYDADGNQMDTYPLDSDMGSLAPGKKVQGIEHHGVDALGTIEVHFAPLISFEDAAVFEVEVN